MDLIEFEILKESWADLTLSDGIRVKIRQCLVFLETDRADANALGIRAPISAESQSPPSLRGEPSPGSFILEQATLEQSYGPADWHQRSESLAVYALADGRTVKLRLTPKSIKRFAFHLANGEPYILIDNVTEVEVLGEARSPDETARGAAQTAGKAQTLGAQHR